MVYEKEEVKKLISQIYSIIRVDCWCEECSTEDHPIMLVQTEGVNFECPLCKKSVMILADVKLHVGSHYSSNCESCKYLESKGIVFGRVKNDN